MGSVKDLFVLEQIRKDELLEDAKIAEVKVKFVRSTDKAVLISALNVILKIKTWIPKSQIVEPDPIALDTVRSEDELVLILPLWLAKSNHLIYKEIHNESNTIR